MKNYIQLLVIVLLIVGSVLYNKRNLDHSVNKTENKITEVSNNILLRMNHHALEIQAVQRIINNTITIDNQISYNYAEEIVKVANRYDNLSTSLLTVVIHHESHFNPLAYNKKSGAMGMGQHMPLTLYMICKTWNEICTDSTIYNYKFSIKATAWYLDLLYKVPIVSRGNWEQVLAYYNGGYKMGYRWGLRLKYESGIELDSTEMELKDKIYDETEDYIIEIMKNVCIYDSIINNELPTGNKENDEE